jgi:hypothetical protein
MFCFVKQRQQQDLDRQLRRIRDLTCPNTSLFQGDSRAHDRQNRTVIALLAPWANETFSVSECTFAITKDLSDRGLSLVLPQPFRSEEVLVGFWPVSPHHSPTDSSPFFAIGEVRQNVNIGGGFWQLGVRLLRIVSDSATVGRLKPLAAQLLPKSAIERTAAADVLAPQSP